MISSLTFSWRDYYQLCKPKVVALIVFTAIVGMFKAIPGQVPVSILCYASFGIALAAASAAVINHIIDQHIDAKMARTRRRPFPCGRVSTGAAIWFASLLTVISMLILTFQVNPLTAALTAASLVGYAIIYSAYLKRATPQNIVIGGAAGAAPPVLGWAAVTGHVDPYAWLLFLIIFAWTPPHFWALAIYRRDDYKNAEVPMLPVTHGVPFTRLQILLYTILMCMVTLLPYLTYMSGLLYLFGIVILNAVFLYLVVRMQWDHSDQLARRIFSYSILYLMGLFLFLLLDHHYLMQAAAPYGLLI